MKTNNLFRKGVIVYVFFLFISTHLVAQVGIGTTTPSASSALDVTSSTAGVLFPRMTTTLRNAITAPAAGLLIYNTTTSTFDYNLGPDGIANWVSLNTGSSSTETRAVKYNNGSGGTARNLNAGGVNVQIYGADGLEFNDDNALYVRNSDEALTITEAGRYRITFNLSLENDTDSGSEKSVNVSLTINGVETGTFVNHGVITRESGHRLSSLNASQVFELGANSVVRIIAFSETTQTQTVSLDNVANSLSDILIEKIN